MERTIPFDKISKSKIIEMLYLYIKFQSKVQNKLTPTKHIIKTLKDKDSMLLNCLNRNGFLDHKNNVKMNLWIEYYKIKNEDVSTQIKVFKKCKKYGLTFSLVCNEPVMDYTTQHFFWTELKTDFDLICFTLGIEQYKYKTPDKFSPIIKKVLTQKYWQYKNMFKRMSSQLDKAIDKAQHLKQGTEDEFVYCENMKNQTRWKEYFKKNRIENS